MTWNEFKDFVEKEMVNKKISFDTHIAYIEYDCHMYGDDKDEFFNTRIDVDLVDDWGKRKLLRIN